MSAGTGSSQGPVGPLFTNDDLTQDIEAGDYVFEAVATAWNSGTATLKRLAPDNVKFFTVVAATADAASDVYALPAGRYVVAFSGGTPTGFVARLARIKGLPY